MTIPFSPVEINRKNSEEVVIYLQTILDRLSLVESGGMGIHSDSSRDTRNSILPFLE